MAIKNDQILKQLDALRSRYKAAVLTSHNIDDDFRNLELATSAQAAIERLAPPQSAYAENLSIIKNDYHYAKQLPHLMSIVDALRHDYAAGSLGPVSDLIRAEVFDDFLEMAEHLLDQGYKDPAAVVAGSVLEQHLRKLCGRVGIPTLLNGALKKADLMNSELAAKFVYHKLDQKSVTSWLGLRNDAAHGHYDRYNADQVRILILGIRDFANRTR